MLLYGRNQTNIVSNRPSIKKKWNTHTHTHTQIKKTKTNWNRLHLATGAFSPGSGAPALRRYPYWEPTMCWVSPPAAVHFCFKATLKWLPWASCNTFWVQPRPEGFFFVCSPKAIWEIWVRSRSGKVWSRSSWTGKIPWRRERLPTPVFLPGEFPGLYSPRGHKESDTTEQLSLKKKELPW